MAFGFGSQPFMQGAPLAQPQQAMAPVGLLPNQFQQGEWNWLERGMMNPLTHLGLGILANNGMVGPGISQGMQQFGQYRQQAQDAIMRQMQMRMAMQKWQQEQAAAQRQERMRQEIQGLLASPEVADSVPASIRPLLPYMEPSQVVGLLTAQPETTDDIREYQFAVSQGYKGTLQDFMLESRRAGASRTNVTVGASDKLVSKGDREAYELVNGEPVPFGWTEKQLAQAVDEGLVRAITPEDAAARALRAKEEAQRKVLDEDVKRAERQLEQAKKAWDASPSPMTKREYDRATETLRRALAGRANPRGEPSNDVARGIAPEPGVVGRAIENFFFPSTAGQQDMTLLPSQPSPQAPQAPAPPAAGSGGAVDFYKLAK